MVGIVGGDLLAAARYLVVRRHDDDDRLACHFACLNE
jgi:hypothetical protein